MARAEYETPEVQVYERGNALRACLRATGKERVIGSRYDDGSTSEVDLVSGVFGISAHGLAAAPRSAAPRTEEHPLPAG